MRSPLAILSTTSIPVDGAQRVLRGVAVGVEARGEAQRVGGDVASGCWVVVSVPVVMQTCFGIEVLAGEPEVEPVDAGVAAQCGCRVSCVD